MSENGWVHKYVLNIVLELNILDFQEKDVLIVA